MKALDLFSGLGGWSDGLAAEGFEVLGVEIEPKIAALYKHPVIVADICDLNPENFRGYDLIVGSPPCRNFTTFSCVFGSTWKNPPDPEGGGMKLVNAFINFVEIAKPTYWLMENVPRLQKWYHKKPRAIVKLGKTMKRAFWGDFPAFLVPLDMTRGTLITGLKDRPNCSRNSPNLHKYVYPEWARVWEQAIIPLPVSQALGKAIRESILSSEVSQVG